MQTAEVELEAQPEFSRVVVNDRLEQATAELERIVREALPKDANLQPPDERLKP